MRFLDFENWLERASHGGEVEHIGPTIWHNDTIG